MSKLLKTILVIINVLAGLALVASAWAGSVDPQQHASAAIVAMTIPVTVPVMLFVLVADCLWLRKAVIWSVICLAVSMPAVYATMPLGFHSNRQPTEAEENRSFSILTYNCMNLADNSMSYPDDVNPTIAFLLEQDADIVCLQEAGYTGKPNPTKHITQEQIDSINARYPYIATNVDVNDLRSAVFSKFPVTQLEIDSVSTDKYNHRMAWYRFEVLGRKLTVFSLHLASYKLTPEDKDLYKELTRFQGENRLGDAKRNLLGKVAAAAVKRAQQTEYLCGLIASEPADRDIILCGDFNDVPASWPIRQFEKEGFEELGPMFGFGYRPTFHADRFYFSIDHILYRGALKPISYTMPTPKWSDHYPLKATFVFDK